MPQFLRTTVVSELEYRLAHSKTGSVYFIRNRSDDTIKIGHSHDPQRRLQQLQVGNSTRLELVGVIAAEIAIESIVHNQLREGYLNGEWFWDRGVTTEWLMRMTQNEPLYRNVWTLVEGRTWITDWTDPNNRKRWNAAKGEWEPDQE